MTFRTISRPNCAAMVACLALMGTAARAQSGDAQTTVVLTPSKSISLDALRKFEVATGSASAPVATMLETNAPPFSVFIHLGDTLDGILREQWGLAAGKDYSELGSLTAQILGLKENASIAARSRTTLNIQPGDTLYLPSVVFGRRKSGPVIVPAAAQIDANKLALEAFAGGPKVASQQIADDAQRVIARLSNVANCKDADSVAPFDAEKLAQRMKDVLVRQPKPSSTIGREIAVLDAGLRGKVGTLVPFFATPRADDSYQSEGGVFMAQFPPSGKIQDLLSKTEVPGDHGTHIMTLVLGGIDTLAKVDFSNSASMPWRLIPIVVEGTRTADNGALVEDMKPSWIVNGVQYLQERNPRLVNMSLETQDAEYLATAMIASTERRLRLYVVASGNGQLFVDNRDTPPKKIKAIDFEYIQSLPYAMRVRPGMLGGSARSHILSVAAHDKENHLTDFSGRDSRHVDLMAPGVCVKSYSTLGGSIATSVPEGITGTSQAAAIVSYAASVVSDILGDSWSPADVKARLLASSVYDKNYRGALSSSGRLSIEGAISARFDMIRYKEGSESHEEIGDFGDLGKRFKDVFLCDPEQIKIGNVWKAIPYMVGDKPTDARWDYVSRFPLTAPANEDDPFDWVWKTCTANFGNVNKVKFNTITGKSLTIDFANIEELIPKHRP